MSDKYIQDIAEIRQMMEKSSRFISLSGLSGVMAGIYALIGAYVAWKLAYTSETLVYDQLIVRDVRGNLTWLMLDAAAVLLLAIITGVYLTRQKAKKQGVKTWDKTAQRLLINLLIPLATGGILVVIFYYQGLIGLIAPTTLIFYGLGLINASYYTYRDVRFLGISEVVLGLVASAVIGYGLLIWAIGFGVLHIIYGAMMYFKYEK
ncbi:hypothetical protein [Roseivirga spongicola]|uniref:Uncharacterized protein n=1 Tax=Roseivirga spongicola TaxID=333140 RepID=A0A150XH74_9BACT|nr:hypothetical protein [Roseivirga spongicola]KYG78057.1 hypothetical protein AWW68_04620 [Roseivirga spongicola]WPZ11793.1 hypothetical protein T7867_06690 [Roseivirga spongicola]